MDTPTNPYSSPIAATEEAHAHRPNANVDFVPIMKRWERLRLLYNGILTGFVLLVTAVGFPTNIFQPGYWILLCICGLIANLCFMTAPAIEAYGRCLRIWHSAATALLFITGLFFTAILALLLIIEYPDI